MPTPKTLKCAPSSDLLEVIRAAKEGRYFFSMEVHAKVVNGYAHRQNDNKHWTLSYQKQSERDRPVFRLLIECNTTAQIAKILCISIKTSEKHHTSVVKKLGISNPVERVKYAIKIDPEVWLT